MYRKIRSVDIVIPVYNEEECLRRNIGILRDYLKEVATFSWKIIIADNASTDSTSRIGQELGSLYEGVEYLRVPAKGRGLALRTAFMRSESDIVSYMDVDISTNLSYFKLLVEGIACGFDIATGTRLMQGSRVKREIGREVISRTYNLMIKCLFFTKFSDAQCGFKAVRTDIAKKMIPLIENNNWFFDTELLLLAEYHKYRIFEVPVEWVEDLKTKVHIAKTVIEDILGLLRMRLTIREKVSGVSPEDAAKTR